MAGPYRLNDDRLMHAVAIDFETANEQRASPCSIGLAWINDGVIAAVEHHYIRPPGMRFASFNIAFHGIGPEQVRLIVLSHLHGDHVAGLRDFPDARVVVGDGALAPGWRDRSAWANTAHGFVPDLLPDDLDGRLLPLAELTVGPTGLGERLRNGYDLFGDGTAFVLPLPGRFWFTL